jgi:circadian clock protein KaiC
MVAITFNILIKSSIPLERISTGISGIDGLIEGGIPKGSTVLIAGNPGTGKTILTAHFLYDGLIKDENALYVSFSESKEQFFVNTERFEMDFRKFLHQNRFSFLDLSSFTSDGIQDALEEVLATIKETHAKRIVIDSFSAILQSFQNINEARIALHVVLGKMLRGEGVTNMLIAEVPIGTNNIGSGIEEFVADGIIKLEHGNDNAIPIIVKIIKMRSTAIDRQPHVCVIKKSGMIVFPKQSLQIDYNSYDTRIKTGIIGLDERIQGGFLKGTTTAIIGASGVGKTTFGLQFIANGVINGKSGIYCTLEESSDELQRTAVAYGYNIDELKEKGLHILSQLLENQSPDEFIFELEKQIIKIKPTRIVVDSLSAFEHQYKDQLYIITKRISNLIRKHQLTAMFIILTTQSDGLNLTDLGISSLFHNIFLLRYMEAEYRMKRSMLILKMRATHHDQSILEFVITDNGMRILGIMDNYGDILKDVVQPYNEVQKKEEITLQEEEMKRRIAEYKAREMEIRNRENREQNKRKQELEKNLNNIHKNNVGNE